MIYIRSSENKVFLEIKKQAKEKNSFFLEGERWVEDALLRSDLPHEKSTLLFSKKYAHKFFSFLENLGFIEESASLEKQNFFSFSNEKIFLKLKRKEHAAQLPFLNEKKQKNLQELLERAIWLEEKLFEKLSGTVQTQGIALLCLASLEKEDFSLKGRKTFILENVQDPGNLGTILRTASAFGYHNVLFVGENVKLQNEKVIRASMGALLKLQYKTFENWTSLSNFLKKEQVLLLAGSLQGQSLETFCAEKTLQKKAFALLVGNEGRGLSQEALQHCDYLLKIPMEEQVESLNVAVALSIMAYRLKNL